MLDPIRLVDDLFKEKNLSNEGLHSFAEDFLARLSKPALNPGGIYNSLLVDTTTLYQNYFGKLVDESKRKAVGKGITTSLRQANRALLAKISLLENLVSYHFKRKSDIYLLFYPRGVREYYRATLGHRATLGERYSKVAHAHLNALYPGEVSEFDALLLAFNNAHQAQEGSLGSKTVGAIDRRKGRALLTQQLTKCLLRIASDLVEKPERFREYYDTRPLPIRKAKKKKKEQ